MSVVNNGHISALAAKFASSNSCDGNKALDAKAAVKGINYVTRTHVKERDEMVRQLEECQKRYEALAKDEQVIIVQLTDPKLNGEARFVERALKRVRFDMKKLRIEMKARGKQIDFKNTEINHYRGTEMEVKNAIKGRG